MIRFFSAVDEIINHLHTARRTFKEEGVEGLLVLILKAHRIFVYGAGRSGHVGRMFTQRLMHLGLNSFFVGETLTPSMDKDDLLIVISGSGQTTSTLSIVEAAKDHGAKVVCLTAHTESPIAERSDLVVSVAGKTKLSEFESYAPFTTLFDIACLTYLDSLASEIMARLNLSDDDILRMHATVE
jgi:6-phospho 3-hexuloisomerase